MIYIDSSVALAALLAETKQPPDALWAECLFSSRLLEFEVWNRIFARGMGESHRVQVELMLRKIYLVELSRGRLRRALRPFPAPIRTLDALHLATAEFLRSEGETIELASYDQRLLTVAQALGIAIAPL